jgi:hypothetical protein
MPVAGRVEGVPDAVAHKDDRGDEYDDGEPR